MARSNRELESKKQRSASTSKSSLPRPNKVGKKVDVASTQRRTHRHIQARVASAITGRKRLNRGPFAVSSNTAKGEYTFAPGSPKRISTPSKAASSGKSNPARWQRGKKVKNPK